MAKDKKEDEFFVEGQGVPPKEDIKIPVDKPLIETEEVKPAKKRKRRKTKPKGLELSDIKIPLALLVMSITNAVGGKWVATDKELIDIEDGFNLWVEYRFSVIQKFAPEFVLLIPIVNYLTPRMWARRTKSENLIPEGLKSELKKPIDKKDKKD